MVFKSYLNADGFLGGLNLNKDNTRLRPEYEDILRFYGFDFTIDEAQMNTTDSTTIANLAESTTMGNATISTMQSLMDGITTMNSGGSTNQPAGNDTTTTAPSTEGGTPTAPTTIPPTATTLPTTDGTVPTTTNSPTTIDTSVDIITVTPGKTPPPAASANSSTTPVVSTIQTLDMLLNMTDLPARLSSIAAEANLSTQMVVNNTGSASDPRMNRVAGGGIVTSSTPGTDSFRFSPPMTTKATTTETMTSTTTEPTTILPKTKPARSTAFNSGTTTAATGASTLTVRSSSSDNFKTVPRIGEPITSTMGSRMTTGGGSTASMMDFETVSVVVREFDSETTTGAGLFFFQINLNVDINSAVETKNVCRGYFC